MNLLSLANAQYIISSKPLVGDNLSLVPSANPQPTDKWLQSLTRWLQSSRIGAVISDGISTNFYGRRLYIYKNENCLPRAFLASKIEVYENYSALLEAMSKSSLDCLRHTAFFEKQFSSEIEIGQNHLPASGDVKILEYSPDKLLLETDCIAPCVLIITNSYSPYWRCMIDGQKKDIFPVDHAFLGISLDKGRSRVSLEYHPPYEPLMR